MSRKRNRTNRNVLRAAYLNRTQNLDKPIVSTAEIRSTAYHEAAHTVFYLKGGFPIESVTARPVYRNGEWMRGATFVKRIEINVERLVEYVKAIIAGDLAQHKLGTMDAEEISSSDEDQLRRALAGTPFTTIQVRAQLEPIVRREMEAYWPLIEALAERLQIDDFVSGEEAEAIVAGGAV